ncbi:MAG TPA: CUB domain-containing protein, partial [Bacteroidales bacterium]|nr:CUB domain-containing protein [Bacteroidales bacterium]
MFRVNVRYNYEQLFLSMIIKYRIYIIFIIVMLAGSISSFAQDYLISTSNGDTIAACIGNFYDSGSNIGNYSDNEKYTVTFHAPAGERIIFDFTSLELRNEGGDTLRIFDGMDTLSTVIGTYTGESLSFTVASSDSALTFQFTSDGSLNNSGWEATISCCPIPITSTITGSNTECVNSTGVSYSVINTPGSIYDWVITGGTQINGTNTNNITVDWGSIADAASVKVIEDNGCTLGDTVFLNVTLNDLPVVSFSGLNTEYDLNLDGVQTLTGSPAGGTFSGPGISGNTFDPLAAGLGMHEIDYKYTDGNFCVNSDTLYTEVKNYDFIAGARTLTDLDNWYSGDAVYSTLTATADGSPGSCWNYGNDHTRWFKFQATTEHIAATFLTGGSYGTARRINAALWEADGTTQIGCNRYVYDYDSVVVQSPNLVPGNWYYISVTTGTGGYRGTFSLRVNDQVDYDYYEGAVELTDLSNWKSQDAIYTTLGATADGNAGSCWNYGNDYTRWFKFQATTSQIAATFLTDGSYGTARRINAALWEADGTTQIDCNRYASDFDSVSVQSPNLVPGNWYYISVTTGTGAYRGTFSLRVNDQVNYDYYEGAI